MHQIISSTDLRELGEAMATDGLGQHEQLLAAVAAQVRSIEPASVLAEVLGDLTAPVVVRSRAFASIAADWSRFGLGQPTAANRPRTQDSRSLASARPAEDSTTSAFGSSDASTNRAASASVRPNSTWRPMSRRRRVA